MKRLVAVFAFLLLLPAAARAQVAAPLPPDVAYTVAIFDGAAAVLKANANRMKPGALESAFITLPPQKRAGQPVAVTVGDVTALVPVDVGRIVAAEGKRRVVPSPAPFRLALYRRKTPAGPADELAGVIPNMPQSICAKAAITVQTAAGLPMPAPRVGPVVTDANIYAVAGPVAEGAFNCVHDEKGVNYIVKFLAARHQTDTGAWAW